MEKRIAEQVLALATSAGADAAEIYLRSATSTTVEVKEQKVEAFESSKDGGAGLRVQIGERMGFAFTTSFADNDLRSLARAAAANARNTEPDRFNGIATEPAGVLAQPVIFDPEVATLSEEEKIRQVMALEREAFAVDQRVKRIRKASGSFSLAETLIMNSKGAEASYRGTACSASIEVVAEEHNEAQAGWEHDVRRFYRKLDFGLVGRRAAKKALDLLGARHIESVKAPVILDAGVAEEFLSIMAGGFSAENVQKRKSLFIGKMGQMVASPLITIVDNGLLDEGLGTAPVDDELTPMRKKTVIDQGRLALFLYNTYAARKDGVESTGNGMRGGFKGVPGVGVTNLSIQPGTLSPEDLISQTSRGLFVNEIMGAHTANPVSGDFSVGATGF